MPPRTRTATATAPPPPSAAAAELVAAGAAPTSVDVDAMLAQIRQLQRKVDAMSADRGIPTDPVEAAMQNLRAHVKTRKIMHRRVEDFAELDALLSVLDDNPHVDDTAFLIDVCNAVSNRVEGIEYIRQLARDAHSAARQRDDDESDDESDDETDEDGVDTGGEG